MKNIRDFLSENFQFLEVKFSIYLNMCVFVMYIGCCKDIQTFISMIQYGPHNVKMCLRAYVARVGPDQPAYPCSLIRAFAICKQNL